MIKQEKKVMARFTNTFLASIIVFLLGVGSALGNPNDPTVVSGSAHFETAGSEFNVTNTPGAIIDWNSFSIAQDEITRFIQQSSSSAVLNRVTGGNLSEILGDLQSNGRVFLINPNGLIMGDGAIIDTAGFIGSTLNISNDAFSSGNYTFNGDGGTIENRGLIHVTGDGDIALIATSVENSGVLRSDNGDILLAAGRSVSVSFDGLQNLSFEVQAPDNQAINLGDIVARGGNASLLGGRVSNSGNIELVESPEGRIFLQATDLATVSGRLTTSGADIHLEGRQLELHNATLTTGGSGIAGDISLLGDNVGVFAGSTVDASGDSGGGTILIGGEQQGRGDTRTSEFVYLDRNAQVSANGGIDGDGGTVILFAKDTARIHGQVTAQGGTQSGDGGFIETSGLIGLRVTTSPNAGAINGVNGSWLIDPYDIVIGRDIEGGQSSIDSEQTANGDVFTASGNGAYIHSDTIEFALNSNSVIVDTGTMGDEGGDITIQSSIVQTESGNSLTLNAARDIYVNATIDLGDFANTLQFNADQSGAGVGRTILGPNPSVFDCCIEQNSGALVVLQAGNIEFNNGLFLPDNVSESDKIFEIYANTISITGGGFFSGGDIGLFGSEVNIDSLFITPGLFFGNRIRGGFRSPGSEIAIDSEITIGSLQVSAEGAAAGSRGSRLLEVVDANVRLTGTSLIQLYEPSEQVEFSGERFQDVIFGGDLVNQGILNLAGVGVISGGDFTNESSAVLNIFGGISVGEPGGSLGLLQNFGVVNILPDTGSEVGASAPAYISGRFENTNALLNINSGAELVVDSLFLSQSELHLDGGMLILEETFGGTAPVDLDVGEGSTITGNGTISTLGEVRLLAGGTLAPGNSPGSLIIDGNLALFDGSNLDLELGGPNPEDFDHISVGGDLIFAGSGSEAPGTSVLLNLTSLDGYDPDPDFSHNIVEVAGEIIIDANNETPFTVNSTGFETADFELTGNAISLFLSNPMPPVDEPPVDEPPAEEPPAEEPVAEEPVAEEPVAEEPVAEEPEMQDPTIDDEVNDIINDVVAIGGDDSEGDDSPTDKKDGDGNGDSEDQKDEIEMDENQCQ
ncbi:MAG: filamentous hemagglutinin family protein [Arenicella sp.]